MDSAKRMNPALLMGLIGSVICGGLQVISMTVELTGTWGGLIFYGPMIFYFTCIYLSIRKTKDLQPDGVLPFKTGLKAGGITAAIICFFWGMSFYVGLTHQNPGENINKMIANGEIVANGQLEQIKHVLAGYTNEHMFEVTKFWAMPNFLLGFLIIILSTVLIARRKKV